MTDAHQRHAKSRLWESSSARSAGGSVTALLPSPRDETVCSHFHARYFSRVRVTWLGGEGGSALRSSSVRETGSSLQAAAVAMGCNEQDWREKNMGFTENQHYRSGLSPTSQNFYVQIAQSKFHPRWLDFLHVSNRLPTVTEITMKTSISAPLNDDDTAPTLHRPAARTRSLGFGKRSGCARMLCIYSRWQWGKPSTPWSLTTRTRLSFSTCNLRIFWKHLWSW